MAVPRRAPYSVHAEPLAPDTKPLAPGVALADLACYPCRHFDTVRRPRGILDAEASIYPRCAQGYPGCPQLGRRCHDYDPQPHLEHPPGDAPA